MAEQFGNPNIVKNLHLDKEGRDRVIAGANKLAKAVGSTLGASGRTVLIEDEYGNVQSTKDGVSVASYITLTDEVENLGATLIKQAAKKTADVAGDGTTSATILAAELINGFAAQDGKHAHSFRDIKRGIEMTRDSVLVALDKKSTKVSGDMLKQVAIISTNSDVELGTEIVKAFDAAGDHGVVTVSDSFTSETYIKSVEGTHLKETCLVDHFYTDKTREVCELEKPLVLLATTKLENIRELNIVLEFAVKANRAIILIAPLGQQPLSALALNALKQNIKCNVIGVPSFGLRQKDLMGDLALLTGATVIDETVGDALDRITPELLGNAVKTISDSTGTTILTDPNKKLLAARVKEVTDSLATETNFGLKIHLENRLALLTGGVSQIFVGAETGVAQKETKDRVDDAVAAIKAAKKEGIIPGGGSALKFLGATVKAKTSNQGEVFGENLLRVALAAPFNKLLVNANLDPTNKQFQTHSWGRGVDTIKGEVVDMVAEGIIDPTLVAKEVVKNAVSVALTILSSDVIISNVRKL